MTDYDATRKVLTFADLDDWWTTRLKRDADARERQGECPVCRSFDTQRKCNDIETIYIYQCLSCGHHWEIICND